MLRVIVLLAILIGIFRLALKWDRETARRRQLQKARPAAHPLMADLASQASRRRRRGPVYTRTLHTETRRTGTD